MFINAAISYLGAWEDINNKYQREYQDIIRSVESIGNIENIGKFKSSEDSKKVNSGRFAIKLVNLFELSLEDQGWSINHKPRKALKNMVGVEVMFSRAMTTDNWLFRTSVLSVKGNVCELPILILPMKELNYTMRKIANSMGVMSDFEGTLTNLNLLSPLYLNTPFLILGISEQEAPFEFYEIPSNLEGYNENVIMNRSIEFPPEYYQAGLGILSYFHKILKEKYPGIQATVRIIQEDLFVKMIVETKDGNKHIVEKALEEYDLIIKGEIRPEEYFNSPAQVLELRNELRMAKFRVETLSDMLALQKDHNEQLSQLIGIISNGLSRQTLPTTIHFSPEITVQNSLNQESHMHNELKNTIETIRDLKNLLHNSDDKQTLNDVESVLSETDASNLKNSDSVSKLKGFLDTVNNTESTISKAINSTNEGIQLVKKLGKHYNTIASMCGLPEIPFI